jgi:ParB-like chromosome segregation protein Spo0J
MASTNASPRVGDAGARKVTFSGENKSSENSQHTSVAQLQFHPLADTFPLIEGAEFDELVTDVKAHGLIEPIVLLDNHILDGRNRYRACIEAGVEPIFASFVGADPAALVISANIRRRHLNSRQKRELIANLIKAMPEKSNRAIADTAMVDHKTVASLRAEKEATGEIPQFRKTVGKDGKARKQRKRRWRAQFNSPTESQHDRDLRALTGMWESACESAQQEFLVTKADQERLKQLHEEGDRHHQGQAEAERRADQFLIARLGRDGIEEYLLLLEAADDYRRCQLAEAAGIDLAADAEWRQGARFRLDVGAT